LSLPLQVLYFFSLSFFTFHFFDEFNFAKLTWVWKN
jgi:hypothetical protein